MYRLLDAIVKLCEQGRIRLHYVKAYTKLCIRTAAQLHAGDFWKSSMKRSVRLHGAAKVTMALTHALVLACV